VQTPAHPCIFRHACAKFRGIAGAFGSRQRHTRLQQGWVGVASVIDAQDGDFARILSNREVHAVGPPPDRPYSVQVITQRLADAAQVLENRGVTMSMTATAAASGSRSVMAGRAGGVRTIS
jgi:hypothetical protein